MISLICKNNHKIRDAVLFSRKLGKTSVGRCYKCHCDVKMRPCPFYVVNHAYVYAKGKC